jgi:hypothetical protein
MKQQQHQQLKRTVRKETVLFPQEANTICDAAAISMMHPAAFLRHGALQYAYKILKQQTKQDVRP